MYTSSKSSVTLLSKCCNDPFAILCHSFSLIFSPFYMSLSRWSLHHFTWLTMVDLFAILCDSFSLICYPFYVTQYRQSVRHFMRLSLICSQFYVTLYGRSLHHYMWLILHLFAILYDSYSLICSPFCLTHYGRYFRHSCDSFSFICSPFMWLILLDLFAIRVTHSLWSVRHSCGSFTLICSPFYVTHFFWYLLIDNLIPSTVLVTSRVSDIINLTNVNFAVCLY